MKKILWISIALALTGCGKQTQAETIVTPTTTVIEQTSVSKELAEQASREVEELSRLEAMGKITYDEESGDILAVLGNEEETHNQVMEVLRDEVRTGKLVEADINDTVRIVCDFLEESKQNEFISDLHSLVNVPPTPETKTTTKPKEIKAEIKPAQAPTQVPAVTETQQTEPVYQEPTPQPQPTQQENNNTSGEIDTSGWDTGGVKVRIGTVEEQHLTDEQIEEINNAQWN